MSPPSAPDGLGFAPLDASGSQLLFRFVVAAYEPRSLGLAIHLPFNEWGQVSARRCCGVAVALLAAATSLPSRSASNGDDNTSRRTFPLASGRLASAHA